MTSPSPSAVSVNAHAEPLICALVADAQLLRLKISTDSSGATIVDAGIDCAGGIEAGRRIAMLCMAGLGQIQLVENSGSQWPYRVMVGSHDPVIACLASQYAGWSLSHGEGKQQYRAMGSGPARALAASESLFKTLGYSDQAARSCLILETDKPPPSALVEQIASDCRLAPAQMTIILTPTQSQAGLIQIVSRVLEVAMHKVHELKFDLTQVVDGLASAPLPPPSPDFLTSMGRSNDAILLAGTVHLMVNTDDNSAQDLARQMPSEASPDYGRPFADIFKAVQYDFYKIDPMLFAPALVNITNLKSGRTFTSGHHDNELLARSFGGPEPIKTQG